MFFSSLLNKALLFTAGLLVALSSAITPAPVVAPTPAPTAALGSFTPVQAPPFKLAGSGITASATTIVLQSFKLADASTTITIADLGTIAYATIEPGTSKEEQVSFTGVTQNANGTATLTGVTRGLDFRSSSCAAVSANQKAHAGGARFILSNTACYYAQYPAKTNSESISGTWTFSTTSIPRLSGQGTWGAGTEEYFVTKRYADALALAGVSDASLTQKGVLEIANKSELAAGTGTGGSTARLVPENSYFNATSSATTTVPVTGPNGKLSQGFLDLTQPFTYSGGLTSTATTTLSSTTTVSGTLTVSGPATFSGTVTGTFPGTRLTSSTTDVTAAGTTSETTLISYSVPANTLGTTAVVRGELDIAPITWNNTNSSSAIFRLKYGATTVATTTLRANSTGLPAPLGKLVFELYAAGATSSQEGSLFSNFTNSQATIVGTATSTNYSALQYGSSAIDSTSAQNLVLSVQPSDTSDSITMSRFFIGKYTQ